MVATIQYQVCAKAANNVDANAMTIHAQNSKHSLITMKKIRPGVLRLTFVCLLITTGVGFSKPLTQSDISVLIGSGFTTEQIMKTVRKEGLAERLDKDAFAKLRQDGASPELILALILIYRRFHQTAIAYEVGYPRIMTGRN